MILLPIAAVQVLDRIPLHGSQPAYLDRVTCVCSFSLKNNLRYKAMCFLWTRYWFQHLPEASSTDQQAETNITIGGLQRTTIWEDKQNDFTK
jgi:hypothetical protein